jgi:hypothetical protein
MLFFVFDFSGVVLILKKISLIVLLILTASNFAQRNLYSLEPADSAEFAFTDFGNMWTFDAVPKDSFKVRYGFTPSDEWLDRVMRSALQFGGGCSGAFVSADGLIMTNHHCGRNKLKEIERAGENLLRDGFYAPMLHEERKVPGVYVDQLMFIEDVSDSVLAAFDKGKTPEEKIDLRNQKIAEIEKYYSANTGLHCRVVNLYNGKKFSLYGYKRYDDIRLVMSPDFQIAATGWDWDNFTYPRYELDFMFFRAYENDKPVKSNYFFPIAKNPVRENDAVFVVGRPGHTDRHISVCELNYLKNHVYKQRLAIYDAVYNAYFYLFENCKDSTKHSELLNAVMGFGNGRKSYAGRLLGLRDNYLIAKKEDFERKLQNAVNSDSSLKKNYGDVWENIDKIIAELSKISDAYAAYSLSPFLMPKYVQTAAKLVNYVEKKNYSENEIEKIANDIAAGIPEDEYETALNAKLTEALLKIYKTLVPNDSLTRTLYGKYASPKKAAENIILSSVFTNRKKAKEIITESLRTGKAPHDPFVLIVSETRKKSSELHKKIVELKYKLAIENQRLSKAITEVYGDVIPPDATLTLRISDGKVKGYEYNGTLAPAKTTFYGLWDRYVSFGKKEYPWGLHPRWQTPPAKLNLETPIGFASTNDIVGGNSGSSVIDTNGEVVGLVHDGNLESLAGHFIFDPTNNRAVSSDIFGIIAALKYVYKTPNLVKELIKGKSDE